LEARDQRAFLKKQFTQKGFPCLSLSLNVPGFPKSNSITNAFFKYCLSDLKNALIANRVEINQKEAVEVCDMAGDFFLVPCSTNNLGLTEIKQICEDFEENHSLGRLIDVDLNDQEGNSISSGKSKLCFFCLERPAIECRREKVHDFEELRSFMFPKMASYCKRQKEEQLIKKYSSLAQQAIFSEISLTPKPGLVDKFSFGSHADMNFQTFIDSTSAISPWFGELVSEGFNFQDEDLTKALPLIRNIGLRMETSMFDATRNVNTQKGIIFLMGLSLFACGKLSSENDHFNADGFRTIIRSICKDLVKKELGNINQLAKSHGEDVFVKFGFSGARGEAESGFRMVFKFGFPQLAEFTELSDEVLIKCFLSIAANNDDTNILYRSNPEVLATFRNLCKMALENFNDANYSLVIDYCKNENISPGGSADLLAVTIFVWSVMRMQSFNKTDK